MEMLQKSRVQMALCKGLYESNQFESAKAELHNSIRTFEGLKTRTFKELLFVDEFIKVALGDGLTPFFDDYEKVIIYANDLYNEKIKEKNDKRPLWKILREKAKCDVQSILDIEEEVLSPLERARRIRAFDIFTQVYMGRAWIDVVYLKNLRKNPAFVLEQCPVSKEILEPLITKQFDVVKPFLKNLHAREPMYYKRNLRYANQQIKHKVHEDYLFRIQSQTRRNMLEVFSNIRRFRANRDILRLEKYIEEVMGDYVVLKTHRVMPWKFEFMNEIYNSLALALIEQYAVPAKFDPTEKRAVFKLLRVPKEKPSGPPNYVFGVRSKRHETVDARAEAARKLVQRLQKRLVFAKHAIERSYLCHQIANTYFKSHRFDVCLFRANKAIVETQICNSYIWRFLSKMLVIKTHVAMQEFDLSQNALLKVRSVAEKLQSSNLINFIAVCLEANEEAALAKKASLVTQRESNVSDWSNE